MNTTAAAPIITFDKVNKWYGDFHVLRDIDLAVAKGESLGDLVPLSVASYIEKYQLYSHA